MEAIVELLKSRGKALDIFELADALLLPVDEIHSALQELARTGRVAATKKGKYALPEDMDLVAAKTMILRSGAQVARPLMGGADMLIRERGELRPMLDDLILVRPEPHTGDGMGPCKLIAITMRANERITAVLAMEPVQAEVRQSSKAKRGKRRPQSAARTSYVPVFRPIDPRLGTDIELDGGLQGARDGDMVLLRAVKWPEKSAKLRVVIERVFGGAGDIRAQLFAIAARHDLRESFPAEAQKQAESVPNVVMEQDLLGRADLRDLTLFTIDGEDAQDFDDAVSLEAIEGGLRLGVHIADVSHYVLPGTPIDVEAQERGTSVYLPGLTLPMLPESLSNFMCSLMPDVDRLAMSLQMDIIDGNVTDHTLSPSVIRSRARLTYEQVNKMLGGQPNNVPEALHDTLRGMIALAETLRSRRQSRGSIDFDMPESAFTLGADGHPTDVHARSRGESERMIEDFMLIANEVIAELARTTELPLLYRVHEKPDPDRVRSLASFLRGLGINVRLGQDPSPSQYQAILSATADRADARLIQQVMLKSLRRAEYSEKPEGHFGLATRDYCHFTSPIRRYPDLMVHRMLKLLLSGKPSAYQNYDKRMPGLAKQCSICEQRATLAERDADDLLKAHYIAGHIGEGFDGVVTGVTAWGLYVTLDNTVEGLVPIRTLSGNWTLVEEKHMLKGPGQRAISLGDGIRIIVERVDIAQALIDFSIDDAQRTQ